MYKMIVFDIDGTILDSRAIIANIKKAYEKFYPERHRDDQDFKNCFFMTPSYAWAYLGIDEKDISAFEDECYGPHSEKLLDLPLCDHIKEVLYELEAYEYILAIATSRTMRDMPELAKPFKDIRWLFKERYIITSDIVKAPKPDPSSLYLLEVLAQVDKDEVLFVGDGASDYECAHRAGVDFALARWAKIKDIDPPCRYKCDDPYDILDILDIKKRGLS